MSRSSFFREVEEAPSSSPSSFSSHGGPPMKELTFCEVWSQSQPLMRPFLRRALRVSQMDFETALTEMVSLLTNPGLVFKQASYRKQTKGRWSRDDPAFAVCQAGFLGVAMLATGAALRARRVLTYAYLVVAGVAVHWLAAGFLASTGATFLANRYLRKNEIKGPTVEWLYAFDVHCNAFFVYFVGSYVLHFFLLPITLMPRSFVAMLVANTLHASAFAAYFYVTHVGFRTLPFLQDTEVFLYPALGALALLLLSIVLGLLGFRLNFSIAALSALIAPLPYS
mmetsp:Transcript_3119/g.10306  ORF Transcript_3119/g.10306 Transcript_3119/m.10306 type:complete len:282 (+) Transcript_3119:1359-2204(+)